jgi:hypothetical protein
MGFLLLIILLFVPIFTQSMVEFDHLVINTNNLEVSSIKLEQLHGFSVKKRPLHKNGIHNFLIEFKENYELEFIHSKREEDEISKYYFEKQIEYPDGSPSFIAFRVHSDYYFKEIEERLTKLEIPFKNFDNTYYRSISLKGEYTGFFFIQFVRPNDYKSTMFEHSNEIRKIKSILINEKFMPIINLVDIKIVNSGFEQSFHLSGVKFVFTKMLQAFPFNRIIFNSSKSKVEITENNVVFQYE